MKKGIWILSFIFSQSCFAQMDTNAIATGDWSDVVYDKGHYALRGRLLVYRSESFGQFGEWNGERVYLELHHVEDGGLGPIEIYAKDTDHWGALHFEMQDASGKSIPSEFNQVDFMESPPPFNIVLQNDSTLRLRVDSGAALTFGTEAGTKKEGFRFILNGVWTVQPNSTNDYFLSATFTPPTNHIASTYGHIWVGTLKLPKVKI